MGGKSLERISGGDLIVDGSMPGTRNSDGEGLGADASASQAAAEAACVAVDFGREASCGLGALGNDGDRPKRLLYDAPVRNAVVYGVLVDIQAAWWCSVARDLVGE